MIHVEFLRHTRIHRHIYIYLFIYPSRWPTPAFRSKKSGAKKVACRKQGLFGDLSIDSEDDDDDSSDNETHGQIISIQDLEGDVNEQEHEHKNAAAEIQDDLVRLPYDEQLDLHDPPTLEENGIHSPRDLCQNAQVHKPCAIEARDCNIDSPKVCDRNLRS